MAGTTFPFLLGGPLGIVDEEPEEPTSPPVVLPPLVRRPPREPIISDEQIVSLHTYRGVQLDQYPANGIISLSWSRELRETSRCELTLPSQLAYDRIPDITPYLHWISVWDGTGQDLYWTGPVMRAAHNYSNTVISAKDESVLFENTICNRAKRWEAADPALIAGELWDIVVNHHNLPTRAVVHPDPLGNRFDFQTTPDEKTMDQVLDSLVQLGLRWSVVSGRPVLGPLGRKAVAALGARDFLGEGPTVIRDGTATANDILLRAADSIARARVPMGGLNLQKIISIDDMFGVSNAERAVGEAVRHTGKIRDSVQMPDDAVLHPDAPVTIKELVPSLRYVIDAYGLLTLQELDRVEVTYASQDTSVKVKLEAVNDDLPELLTLEERKDVPLS